MISGKAKKLLSASGIPGIDSSNVFAYKIPPDAQKQQNNIQILFQDISEYPEAEGSNTFHAYEQHLNMKIFYPVGYQEDFAVIQNKIIKYLKTQRFRFHDSSGVTALPDTDRLSSSVQFWYFDILDEAQ